MGVIERHLGHNQSGQEWFSNALALSNTLRGVSAQTKAGALECKAIALLGLGQPQAAMDTLRQAIACKLPGDIFELSKYTLLRSAPQSLEGLGEMIALLEKSMQP